MTTDQADLLVLNYDGEGEMVTGKEFELKTFNGKGPNDHDHCMLYWQTTPAAEGRVADAYRSGCSHASTKHL